MIQIKLSKWNTGTSKLIVYEHNSLTTPHRVVHAWETPTQVWFYTLVTSSYRPVRVHAPGNFIVLPHWENRLTSNMTPFFQAVTLSWYWENQSLLYLNNRSSGLGSDKYRLTINMTRPPSYPIQSHHPGTVQTSPFYILIILSIGLSNDTYRFGKSLVWFS